MGAGGWSKQGSGVPLAERVRTDRPAPLSGPPSEPVCPARHCWVADAVDGVRELRPGLLLEWRQRGERWEGRVVYVARLRPPEWLLVEEWLPAALLRPA